MWIYKITNKINNKSYIGQTKRTVKSRWQRHINDAMNNILDTHFARAIRKYGVKNFSVETIDSSDSQDELNQLENYYIHKYDSLINGYNETDSINRCGGNTYASKTEEELKNIGEKIRRTKIGGLNPNSKSIKMKDTFTGKEMIFSSVKECSDFLGLPTHHPISKRLIGEVKKLLNDRYSFEYHKEESVSTIPDECKGVGEGTSTSPKQETPVKEKI